MYIELHARSAFSFLEGSSLPEELVGACARLHMPAMALLDADGVYGAPRFHLAAKKLGITSHIGAEITCSQPPQAIGIPRFARNDKLVQNDKLVRNDKATQNEKPFRLPLLVSSRAGYQNL